LSIMRACCISKSQHTYSVLGVLISLGTASVVVVSVFLG
jgi:hypothetical protein